MDESLAEWFAREILVHEEALVRFLARTWPHRDDVYDLRQETYVRVYEAAARSRPASPRAFMYATARNLMADRIRRGRVVSIEVVGDMEALNVSLEEPTPDDKAGTWQQLKRLADALDRLPDRCRHAVWLHKMEDLSYREVAARMGVSVKTVEKQISKGIRRLAQFYLQRDTGDAGTGETAAGSAREEPHG
ncbi:RNA polymerase sigma factor [Luteimonas sp. SDU101]|uniref:RNA polymerase sigma factor n=1 Tax=Luteimonas sp. SDU101 TaxID=3422593 RepID=UPI003EB806E6